MKPRRLYEITIRDNGNITKKWITTSCIRAMEFCHAFGTIGFGLYSSVKETIEIPEITQG